MADSNGLLVAKLDFLTRLSNPNFSCASLVSIGSDVRLKTAVWWTSSDYYVNFHMHIPYATVWKPIDIRGYSQICNFICDFDFEPEIWSNLVIFARLHGWHAFRNIISSPISEGLWSAIARCHPALPVDYWCGVIKPISSTRLFFLFSIIVKINVS